MISSVVAMKAILLAGGKGTRLRPLTVHTPKPIVPIFDRPFLHYQLDLLKQVPEIDEVILSLNYQPRRIEEVFGDGGESGLAIRYVVEPAPLGTGGAIRFASETMRDSVVVFNGDVLTQLDLAAVIALHRERKAKATIVLTPVDNPTAYGLVETDAAGNVTRFLEKPNADEITCDTINAGIYVLDGAMLARIPPGRVSSMEREFFPGLLADGLPFFGWVGEGYWIDIGSPEKYRQAQLDLMEGRVTTDVGPAGTGGDRLSVAADAMLGARVSVVAPLVIGAGCRLEDDCHVGPAAVLGPGCVVGAAAAVEGAVLWERVSVGAGAVLRDCIIGADVRVGPHAHVGPGVVLEDGAVVAPRARVVR
jgi:NDP-sugar pyrophosphorylase family protein